MLDKNRVRGGDRDKQSCPFCPDPHASASGYPWPVYLKGQCTPPPLPGLAGLCMAAEAETHFSLFQAYPWTDRTAALNKAVLYSKKTPKQLQWGLPCANSSTS